MAKKNKNKVKVVEESKTNLLNPFQFLGALAGDLVELTKSTGDVLMDIPSDLERGFDKGFIVETDEDRLNKNKAIEKAAKKAKKAKKKVKKAAKKAKAEEEATNATTST